MAPHVPQKVADLIDVVEVLLPCSAMLDRQKDLDGDGELDCKMTQEQSEMAESVPEVQGTWQILSARSASSGNILADQHLNYASITMGSGAWCVDSSEMWSPQRVNEVDQVAKDQLPLAFTKVVRFTASGKECRSHEPCDAAMWSFDLAYPTSGCTPGIAGWVQPCTAKLLADGMLVLIRGALVHLGTSTQRPPIMTGVANAADAFTFVNGLAAATGSHFEVVLLQKNSRMFHDVHAFDAVNDGDHGSVPRQLQFDSNSSDDDLNDTTIITTTASTATSTTTSSTSTTTPTTTTTTTTTTTNSTLVNTTGNFSALNGTLNGTINAEIGKACSWGSWRITLFGLAMLLLID